MIGNITKLGLLTAAAILCLALTPDARAADINALMASCSGCHGKDGASTDPVSPIIGGMSATYLAETMTAYKTKERPCPASEPKAVAMCAVAGGLADADIKQIADYLSKQKFVRASQTVDGALAEKGKQIHHQSCEKCHSGNGSVADDDAGILAGQWVPYLKAQLLEFKSGARKVDLKMTAVVDRLDAAGIDALANYYASMK